MLVLASASPRRVDLLKAAGVPFAVLAVDVDESPQGDETPEQHVRRLAEDKARAASTRRPGDVVLGADTVVVVDGRMLGKPRDAADAASMLRTLSGRAHEVLTGVALLCPASAAEQKRCHNTRGASPSSGAAPSDVPERASSGAASAAPSDVPERASSSGAASAAPSVTVTVESTQVWFSPLTSDEIAWYVQSGEPMDKAGAYAIQGLASRFVERIDGSYPNVVGLPVALVYRLLQNVPEIRQFWAP